MPLLFGVADRRVETGLVIIRIDLNGLAVGVDGIVFAPGAYTARSN
jgi:hypothetical protein